MIPTWDRRERDRDRQNHREGGVQDGRALGCGKDGVPFTGDEEG